MITSQKQVAGLVYITNIDNTAGGATVYPLVIGNAGTNPPSTFTATMGDGSTSDLSDWFAEQVRLIATTATSADTTGTYSALISLQTLDSAVATPAVSLVGNTLNAVIPAGYVGSFVWGMAQSIEGGFLLPAPSGAGGGVASVGVTAPIINSGTATNPVIAIDPAANANDVLTFNGAAWQASAPPAAGTGPIAVGAISVAGGDNNPYTVLNVPSAKIGGNGTYYITANISFTDDFGGISEDRFTGSASAYFTKAAGVNTPNQYSFFLTGNGSANPSETYNVNFYFADDGAGGLDLVFQNGSANAAFAAGLVQAGSVSAMAIAPKP